MIVPHWRLLCWFAAVVLPCALLAAIRPEAAGAAAGLAGGFVLLAALDARLSRAALDGLRVKLPEVSRFAQDRPGTLELHISNATRRARVVRLVLPWPPSFRVDNAEIVARLPEATEHSRLAWPCTPTSRGTCRLRRIHLETASRFGWWKVRAAQDLAAELRVYPNLLPECKKLAAFFLHRGQFGMHAQRRIGKGREFEKLREYLPGDSLDEIHWKATAKRGHLVTQEFQVERTQEVYVLLDASRLSARPAKPDGAPDHPPDLSRSALERVVVSALVLALAADRQGDLFGLATFSDRVLRFLRARNGRDHFSRCRDALYTLEPHLVSPDFEEVCSFLRLRLRKRALLVFLTALDDPVLAEHFTRGIEMLSRQHLVQVHVLRPPGVAPLFSNGGVASAEEIYHRLAGHLRWKNLRELGKVLERRGVQFSLTPLESLTAQLVSQYLAIKQRQLL